MEASDQDLLERAQKGDGPAFDALVNRHYSRIYGLAYRFLGNRDEAADATQETFLKAFQQLSRFRGRSAFGTWLFRICVNCCQDILRKRREIAVSQLDGNESEDMSVWDPNEGNPDELISERERARAIQKALAQLDPDFRQVLILCDMEGLTYSEVAEILRIPEGTVKSRLHRARWAFKEVWVRTSEEQGRTADRQKRGESL
ncbi:MAG: sigma-70 family RNA polymerase sigma factor [Armatimonadetes bacterium]|nr:sigma-70 family RNA polymerase sigma factor [Armatimonadota bacterium]MDW8122612.1 sigma-70 family RNA polymerase sigma factor [Armatimonadota bacterium]